LTYQKLQQIKGAVINKYFPYYIDASKQTTAQHIVWNILF